MGKDNKAPKMLRSTFSVMFYINKTKIKKDGMCQVLCRITVDTGAAQIGTKVGITPDLWNAKTGRAFGRSRQSLLVNRTIGALEAKINGHYRDLVDNRGFVTAEMVKNALNGIGCKQETLLRLFEEHNEEYAKRIGVNRVKATLEHYQRSYALLKMFIETKYGAEDVTLRSLTLTFIDAFDLWLRVDRLMAQSTISGHLINLKKIVRRAVSQGTIKRDPFITFVPEQPPAKCRHLKTEEIERLMQAHIVSDRVRHTRDMFIFSTFTGLAYADLKNLSEKHLITTDDGNMWVRINRRKTGSESNIRLLDIPKQIIEKYKDERKDGKIFNLPTLSNICRHLRKLEKLCNIEYITFHMARHNFGTHITLSEGVPIETVSRMMGHSSISTTQIYAKITDKKLREDSKRLSGRLTGKYSIFEDEQMPVGIRLNDNFRLSDNSVNPRRKRNYEKRSKEKLEDIEKIYGIAHETGLSGEFEKRRNDLGKEIQRWEKYVLWTSIVLLVGIIVLFICQFNANGCKFDRTFDLNFYVRFLIFSPIVYYLYFVSSQYNKAKKLHDKYVFKTTLSMTIKNNTQWHLLKQGLLWYS